MNKIVICAKPYIDEDGTIHARLNIVGTNKSYRGFEIEIGEGLEFQEGSSFRDMYRKIKVIRRG